MSAPRKLAILYIVAQYERNRAVGLQLCGLFLVYDKHCIESGRNPDADSNRRNVRQQRMGLFQLGQHIPLPGTEQDPRRIPGKPARAFLHLDGWMGIGTGRGLGLQQAAKRGARDTNPSFSCNASELTLYTTPSMAYGKSSRLAPIMR